MTEFCPTQGIAWGIYEEGATTMPDRVGAQTKACLDGYTSDPFMQAAMLLLFRNVPNVLNGYVAASLAHAGDMDRAEELARRQPPCEPLEPTRSFEDLLDEYLEAEADLIRGYQTTRVWSLLRSEEERKEEKT